jgi:hypothetical protein
LPCHVTDMLRMTFDTHVTMPVTMYSHRDVGTHDAGVAK